MPARAAGEVFVNWRRDLLLWVVVFGLLLVGVQLFQSAARSDEFSREYSQLLTDVAQGKVSRVKVVRPGELLLASYVGEEKPYRVKGPGDVQVIAGDLKTAADRGTLGQLEYVDPSPWPRIAQFLFLYLLPVLLIGGFLIFLFFRQMGQGNAQAMAFRSSRVKRLADHLPRKTFDDVAGVDEAKEDLAEVVDFLRDSEKYRKLGAEIPRGILLMGPPGCGKTLLARAVAGEASVPFFHISGSDFVEMFVGVGASRVRDLFEQAKANRPCIVFVDELDAVGRQRGAGLGGGNDEREQTVNQLLVEMDGFEPNSGIIVLAATNRPDILDPALLRPGRFDRRVVVDYPDQRGRQEILDLYLKTRPVDADVSSDLVARQTAGLTGADLFSIVNEAAILAARAARDKISAADLEEAFSRVTMGRERRSRVMTPDERRHTAYHEAGHALCAHFLPDFPPVHKITILPRGQALGFVLAVPEEERYNRSRPELQAQLAMALGGRVAEELVFGEAGIGTGAHSDLEGVSELARAMVCEYGMSTEIGPRTMGRRHGPVFLGRDLAEDRNYSEEMANVIDQEIAKLVDEAYNGARQIIGDHRDGLERLALALLEHETLEGHQLPEILGPPPPKNGHGVELGEPATV